MTSRPRWRGRTTLRRLAVRTALLAALAVTANVVACLVISRLFGIDLMVGRTGAQTFPLELGPVVSVTALPALAAGVLAAALRGLRRGTLIFTLV